MTKRGALQALLAFVAICHLIIGLCAFIGLPGPVQAIVESVYGAHVTLTPQLQHVIRMLGAFMIAIGVIAGLAAIRPEHSGPIVTGIAILLLLRVLQRLMFANEVHDAFGVSMGKLVGQSVFFLLIAIGLLVLKPRQGQSTPASPSSSAPAPAAG